MRLLVVAGLVVVVGSLALLYRRRSSADAADPGSDLPPLPSVLGDDRSASPSWVIFTTPLCVSCDGVEQTLRGAYPQHRVVKVDATAEPALAERYRVRRAPTVIHADADGRIRGRFVGPEAVRAHLATAGV